MCFFFSRTMSEQHDGRILISDKKKRERERKITSDNSDYILNLMSK
jgi:hypothetical protein